MWYKYGKCLLNLSRGKARFYDNNKVAFIGNDYTGIRLFIEASDNNPGVREKFKSQLEKRDTLRYRVE